MRIILKYFHKFSFSLLIFYLFSLLKNPQKSSKLILKQITYSNNPNYVRNHQNRKTHYHNPQVHYQNSRLNPSFSQNTSNIFILLYSLKYLKIFI